jgi:hypothetical protein
MEERRSGPGGTARLTAEDLRRRFEWLNSFTDDELREISLCKLDVTLQPGESYFDISHPERGVIPGEAGRELHEDCCVLAKSEVPDRIWSKLVRLAPQTSGR